MGRVFAPASSSRLPSIQPWNASDLRIAAICARCSIRHFGFEAAVRYYLHGWPLWAEHTSVGSAKAGVKVKILLKQLINQIERCPD